MHFFDKESLGWPICQLDGGMGDFKKWGGGGPHGGGWCWNEEGGWYPFMDYGTERERTEQETERGVEKSRRGNTIESGNKTERNKLKRNSKEKKTYNAAT